MPSGNLPALNFLGDGQRTTGEFQAAVNELQNYVVALKNEVDALSNTVVKESAVRTVGSGTGDIPDKAVLDTRLGTEGNLSGMATEDPANYISNSDLNTPKSVWTGQQNALNISELSEGGPGLYIVRDHFGEDYSIYIRSTTNGASGSAQITAVGAEYFRIKVLRYTSSGDFRIEELTYTSPGTQQVLLLIGQVYKVYSA